MGETVAEKAERLLTTGRVHVLSATRYIVDGDTGRRVVAWDGAQFRCNCPAAEFHLGRTCSHVEAVERITQPPPAQWNAP